MSENDQRLQKTPLAFSRNDASEYLSLSVRTFDRLVSDGKIRTIKVGTRSLVLETELLRFLNQEMEAQHG